jgi:hypothetical protein
MGTERNCRAYTDGNVSFQRMKINWTRRGISIAIAAALVLLVTTLAHCQANSKQKVIVSLCVADDCIEVNRSSIAIVPTEIHITLNGIRTTYKILHYFIYKHEHHYRIKGEDCDDFNGWLIVDQTGATIELYNVMVRYIFIKKENP